MLQAEETACTKAQRQGDGEKNIKVGKQRMTRGLVRIKELESC